MLHLEAQLGKLQVTAHQVTVRSVRGFLQELLKQLDGPFVVVQPKMQDAEQRPGIKTGVYAAQTLSVAQLEWSCGGGIACAKRRKLQKGAVIESELLQRLPKLGVLVQAKEARKMATKHQTQGHIRKDAGALFIDPALKKQVTKLGPQFLQIYIGRTSLCAFVRGLYEQLCLHRAQLQ